MRKILLTAAIATISACTKPVKDIACSTSAECAAGDACAVDTQLCVAGAITIDSGAFYDDGARWLSAQSGPAITGEIDASGSLVALVSDQVVATATINGSAWSLTLPSGTLDAADTAVVFRFTGADGHTYELTQAFAYDDSMPAVQLASATFHDERGDQIDFSSGVPQHTHAGPIVSLGGTTTCPDVYKYAYLMDANEPMFGGETSRNPLAFEFNVQEPTKLDAVNSAYRLRGSDGTPLLDWTTLPAADDNGAYDIALYRRGDSSIPALGTYEGQLTLDVRVRDWAGREADLSTCWIHHPLAAPLQVWPAEPGSIAGLSLSPHTPLAVLFNAPTSNTVPSLFDVPIVQQTSEPIVLSLTVPELTGSFAETTIATSKATATNGPEVSCPLTCPGGVKINCYVSPSDDPRCFGAANPTTTTSSYAGPVSSYNEYTTLVDDVTNEPMPFSHTLDGFVIPGRTAADPPHGYHLVEGIATLGGLQPVRAQDYSLPGASFTGTASTGAPTYSCNSLVVTPTSSGFLGACASYSTFEAITAVQTLSVSFKPVAIQFSTAPTAANTAIPVPYLPDGALTATGIFWDAGKAGL